ncbi:MAG: hydantoinase/carbamoylase family amidase [Micromonosporaceae bacterium]|nr:hydantoinase/carbamoylase family amidase [Micromonosporaceae bacterium]
MSLTVRIDRLRRDLEQVSRFGATAAGGVSRTSFSAADRQVREWLAGAAAQAGLTIRTDGIGNVFLRVDGGEVGGRDGGEVGGGDGAPVWTGSHLDSVPDGGALDGALGSLAALEVARRLVEERVPVRRPVEVVVFADEEGSYHHLCGSTGLVRNYSADELSGLRGRDGDRLVDALAGMGWDPAAATRTAVRPGAVHAFVELHIEQGPILEARNAQIGVVTGIVGLGGGELVFTGRQDHAGTTPMRLRQDPLRGAAELVTRLPELAASVSQAAVATCGIVSVQPGAGNVVPETCRLQLDFRDPDRDRLLALEQAIVAAAEQAAGRHQLRVSYHRDSITDPVALDPRMQDLVESTATRLGLRTLRMPSGAGHDAQNLATLAPTGMIFVPSVAGRSHSPAELTTWDDVENGGNVLLAVVHALATE